MTRMGRRGGRRRLTVAMGARQAGDTETLDDGHGGNTGTETETRRGERGGSRPDGGRAGAPSRLPPPSGAACRYIDLTGRSVQPPPPGRHSHVAARGTAAGRNRPCACHTGRALRGHYGALRGRLRPAPAPGGTGRYGATLVAKSRLPRPQRRSASRAAAPSRPRRPLGPPGLSIRLSLPPSSWRHAVQWHAALRAYRLHE